MMMMGGMAGGMFIASLLFVTLLVGFAYIIWILAAKESGGIKTTGQVIAIIIAVIAALIFLYSGIYGGLLGQGQYMMGPGMMMQ